NNQGSRFRNPVTPPMPYLAEPDTNGSPAPGSAFNANVRLDGPVRALMVSPDGKRLYIGGEFSHVNGISRARIVAINPATGQIDTSFNPPTPDAYVSSFAQYGPRLYIGGAFNNLNGNAAYHGLAALDAGNGGIDPGFHLVPPPY